MTRIKVTFSKKVYNYEKQVDEYPLVTFTHDCDPAKSDYENWSDAMDEAVRKGHDPRKTIKWVWLG